MLAVMIPSKHFTIGTRYSKPCRRTALVWMLPKQPYSSLRQPFVAGFGLLEKWEPVPIVLQPCPMLDPTTTVQGLRSFVGAYKSLSKVLLWCAKLFDPLDHATTGIQSRDKLVWNDSMLIAFNDAQEVLGNCKDITLPQPSDTLHIATEASVMQNGNTASLYILLDGKPLLQQNIGRVSCHVGWKP